ncbi:MAG TPA: protein phosphatase 2C domain-containing protein [Vicinamibacterales bacterium]|jgi:protein phosphatase
MSPVLGSDDFQPLSSTVRLEFGASSHIGRTRTINEDNYIIIRAGRSQETLASSLSTAETPGRFEEAAYGMLVADGLGGSGPGGIASRVALNTLVHVAIHYGRWNLRVDPRTAAEVTERLEWTYGRVNEAVQRHGRVAPELANMATTLTAAYSAGDDLFVAHVGHSRAYLFREGELRQLTRDQTVENRLSQSSRPTAFAYATDDLQHILTDTIGGAGGTPNVQIGQYRVSDGDCVLLCTDGLWCVVPDERIADVLAQRRKLQDMSDSLVELALDAGGPDNVTVLLAQYRVPND